MYLDHVVNDAHGQNDDNEQRSAVADDGNGRNDAKCAHDPRVQAAWQLRVNDVDVLRETVYDAADRRAVEKRHRRPQSALEDGCVQQRRRTQHSLGERKRRTQHGDSYHRTHNQTYSINYTMPTQEKNIQAKALELTLARAVSDEGR